MRCKNCGEKLPKGCTFCRCCNTPVKKKQSLAERIGKVPIIIGIAAAAAAAVGILFFVLSDVPAVKFVPDVRAAVTAVSRGREVSFLDKDGNIRGTVTDITMKLDNSAGTSFMKTLTGDLYIAGSSGIVKADEGISDTRLFACADKAGIVYYEKDGKVFRYRDSPEEISRLYGIAVSVTVSPDGSCAAWCDSEGGNKKCYVYRNGNVEELSGAEETVSITDDGSLMIGTAGDQLVVCRDNSRSFTPAAKCGGITAVSSDRTQVIFKDEHNPADTYLFDSTSPEPVFLYSGSVSLYSPSGMHPEPDSFAMFTAEVTDHKAGTHSLAMFTRDGSSYKVRTLLDLDKVSSFILSEDSKRVIYIKDGTLCVKNTVNTFSKESNVADGVFGMYADSSLSDIYYLTKDNVLYHTDGGTPKKISLNVGAASMICGGVCTFVSDGTVYYSDHGGDIRKADGIGKVKFLYDGTAVSEDEEQYMTLDGKTFINTGIKRF